MPCCLKAWRSDMIVKQPHDREGVWWEWRTKPKMLVKHQELRKACSENRQTKRMEKVCFHKLFRENTHDCSLVSTELGVLAAGFREEKVQPDIIDLAILPMSKACFKVNHHSFFFLWITILKEGTLAVWPNTTGMLSLHSGQKVYYQNQVFLLI